MKAPFLIPRIKGCEVDGSYKREKEESVLKRRDAKLFELSLFICKKECAPIKYISILFFKQVGGSRHGGIR